MNLKEAFRFQNKLQTLAARAGRILQEEENILRVETTVLRKKAMPEAENETVVEAPQTEHSERITELASFLCYLLTEQEMLSAAIRATKNALPIDVDSQTSLNRKRHEIADVLSFMTQQRNGEELIAGGGTGYRFNAEGNQVAYRCDIKRVTTINFDRNKVRNLQRELTRKADAVSAELDRQLVNAEVDYIALFDINDLFADAFEAYLAQV